jgi:hypothetical protein
MKVFDQTLYDRLVDKIRFDLETACWVWHGSMHPTGYGEFHYKGRKWSAHRAMWKAVYDEFDGLDVCHRCDNKRCISPLHLYLATHKQNLRDASKSRLLQGQWKTHCKRGHPLSGDNLYIQPQYGFRGCKQCQKDRKNQKWIEDPEYRARVYARQKLRREQMRQARSV